MKDETVWLNAEQIAKLFDRDYKTIKKHINNALNEELDNSTVAKFAIVQKEGTREVLRNIEYYNLDMIISVGYRVKSVNGIAFRKWANKILKDYLLKGYAVNQKRLDYLEKTVKLIDIASRIDSELDNSEAYEIIKVISNYSNALKMIDNYDRRKLSKVNGTNNSIKIRYKDCLTIVRKLKLATDSNIFALERDFGLDSIIGNIYQSYDGLDLYSTVEEKAANFLYLIVKDHPFIDGNKRIAAALFIYFLEFYNILNRDGKLVIDNNTLVAITLLVAQSSSKEKDILVNLIVNFLCN